MSRYRFFYLVKIQFLGFRYSGWQKQPGQKTLEGMLSKTLKFVLPDQEIKILGASRTDAKVSALAYVFELFVTEPIANLTSFQELLNSNLPSDIRVTQITTVDRTFNIIQSPKLKEYVYLFSFGEKNHPFCAPFMANILVPLDIGAMQTAARCFEGTHDFKAYTARIRPGTKSIRTITKCYLERNTLFTANFFPTQSYLLHIISEGFMRYQVRMIMGALMQVGKGELSIADIRESLKKEYSKTLTYVAPGSGLHLKTLKL